ncbi:sirohydrochlorin chelatase [Streptomyces sp. NPDC050617]|uniref:sirohydrochlorin chelatase n=1 Tax=Streptomyces sp. NPDC050617 TaxID=3154628 RepID=UPI0034350417
MTTPPALLIAGHGTPDEAEAEAFREVVRALSGRAPGVAVAGTLVGRRDPRQLDEAVAALVGEGAGRITAVPLALASDGPGDAGPGGVPAALKRALAPYPGVGYACGRPLGPEPELLAVLERRLDEALDGAARTSRTPSDRAATTVLLVGRGSADAEANAEAHRAARLLWEGRGYAGVETAFVSLAAPDVPSGLDRCVRLGARRIVVLPYVLFSGALPDRVRMQTEGWAAAHPEVEVVAAEAIGPAEELVELVVGRYEEVVGRYEETVGAHA